MPSPPPPPQVAQWLLPEWIPTKWLNLWTQPWEGDVTMLLPSALWQLGQAIRNPSKEYLMHAIKVGGQAGQGAARHDS